MNDKTLSADEVRGNFDKASARYQQAVADVERAQEDLDFWDRAVSMFDQIQARAEGRPMPQTQRDAKLPQRRGLYKGSAAYLIVHLLYREGRGLNIEEILTGLKDTGWDPGKSSPQDAVDRAMRRLVERDYVDQDESGHWGVTEAGLAAARIINGGTPTRGVPEPSKEDHDGPALTD